MQEKIAEKCDFIMIFTENPEIPDHYVHPEEMECRIQCGVIDIEADNIRCKKRTSWRQDVTTSRRKRDPHKIAGKGQRLHSAWRYVRIGHRTGRRVFFGRIETDDVATVLSQR